MEHDTTERLARFAAELSYEDIPERIRERCKDLLLDALACALAGHRGEETAQLFALASALAQSTESRVLGGGRLSLAGATLMNGYLITAVTMCDVYRPTLTHLTPEVVPPALGVAEREGASGRDLLVALASGLETASRVAAGLEFAEFRRRGWHSPGVIGPFGSAAAAGRLLGLEAGVMAAAFGLAGSQAAGTYGGWGTPTIKFHQCRGALSGLLAALLAEQGFVASRHFLTASDGGLYPVYSGGGHPEAVTAGLGDRWEMEEIALRAWPSSSGMQGMITTMLDLVARRELRLGEVAQVRVGLNQSSYDLHSGFSTFSGKFEAMLSAHYAAAAILRDHDLSLDQFEPACYGDPELRRFAAEQVLLQLDTRLGEGQATVEVETSDGEILATRCEAPKGSPSNPLTRSEIEGKFRKYAAGRLPAAGIEAVIQGVSHLEELGTVGPLIDSLGAG